MQSTPKTQPNVTRRLFVAGIAATLAVPCLPDAHGQSVPEDLLAAVERLPAGTAEEKRKKTALRWALEDAEAGHKAGLSDDSAELLADVRAALSQPIGQAGPPLDPAHSGIFPRLATVQNNPWLESTLDKIQQVLKNGQTYPRGSNPDGKDMGTTYSYPYITLSTEAEMMAQALGNPASPLYGDSDLIAPILRRCEACYEILTPNSKHLADFGTAPHRSEMYCLLKLSFPGLILPSRQRVWEGALRRNCDAILKQRGQVFSEPGMPEESLEQMLLHPEPGDCYPNAQSHLVNGLLFAGIALEDDRYVALAKSGVALMATAFYPDGGTAYINLQNECFSYHGIMIEDLARMWQVTGDAKARQLVAAARWYYPLSITPQGVAEYSSAPCWKHYWNGTKGTATAAVLASLERCGYNAQVARNDRASANWLAATTFVAVEPQPWWDNAIFHDRNIEGTRGRFGRYSFCSTTRNTHQDRRGKLTYVGSMLIDRHPTLKQAGWPLAAGLDAAWAEVRVNTRPETVNRWDTHACLSREESNSTISSEYFGSVSALYRLSVYGGQPLPWAARQRWLLTPQRLVGALELEALEDQMAYAMSIALKTVSGRGGSGIRKEWKAVGDNLYEYGPLTVRLWPSASGAGDDLVTAGRQTTSYTDTFSGDTGMCGLLSLVDAASARENQQIQHNYAAGAAVRALVEIYPTEFGGAKSVSSSNMGSGLSLLQVVEAQQTLRLIHNVTSGTQSVLLSDAQLAPHGTILHRVGEMQRLPFLPPVESTKAAPPAASAELLAGHHLVLRSAIL